MRRGPSPFALLLIPAAALVAVLPLMLRGCSCGHDFDFHLVNWMEAAAQFRGGNWHPAWAFSPAWDAGEPRFVFYPPLSWTLGGLLGMVMPWVVAPIVFTWLALAAAGFAMYRLASELVRDQAMATGQVIAAVVYLANPYMIFTAYERTAYAELLAAAWIPLLLASILRERVTVLRVGIPVALLWLTNAPAAVMGCYSLGFLAASRLVWIWIGKQERKSGTAIRTCAAFVFRVASGVLLGLGLAAFYIVPAAYERRWVQIAMATLPGLRIQDNFLFHRTGDGPHDEVLHTVSVIAVLILAATVAVLTIAALRTRGKEDEAKDRFEQSRYRFASLALLTGAIAFLLTPLSAGVWRVLPEMSFLQFPWRLVAVLAAVGCAGIALALARLRFGKPVLAFAALALAAAMSLPAVSLFRQFCDPDDDAATTVAGFFAHSGNDPTDEYTPNTADNDALAHQNAAFWLAKDGAATMRQNEAGPELATRHFSVDAPSEAALVVNLRDYPAWRVRVNGAEMRERIDRADGLIAVPLAAGRSRIDIDYVTTWDREAGEGISLVAVCAACALAAPGVATRRRRLPSRIIDG